MSSHSSQHPQEVFLVQFSLHVQKGGLKPHSFHLHTASLGRRDGHKSPPHQGDAIDFVGLIMFHETSFNHQADESVCCHLEKELVFLFHTVYVFVMLI